MIITITPNPCVDKTIFIDTLLPGDKIRAYRCSCIAGGKGCNVSRAINAMGGETIAVPFVGGHTGKHVVEMLETMDRLQCSPVEITEMTRTITTVLEESRHRQTALFEPGPSISQKECRKALKLIEQLLPEATLIIMSGSAPDPNLDNFYRDVVQMSHEANLNSIVDAYGTIFEQALSAIPYMIKPNIEEAEKITKSPITTRAEQWGTVDRFRKQGIPLVVLSLGAEGALLSFKDTQFHVEPPPINTVNPVGSGDALVAGFALGITQKMDIESMARLGIAMGTANAMSWDIGAFRKKEVDQLLEQVQITHR
ncbi:MAG: 1-phosphofructokinase family hexose kinase [Candidatus Hydrogenedentes bacterium]|nr:1-phosphofructokinase family hexose kinase [Candidatus Hydrogenedentota bacterium]